jgi:hypothetical protein
MRTVTAIGDGGHLMSMTRRTPWRDAQKRLGVKLKPYRSPDYDERRVIAILPAAVTRDSIDVTDFKAAT